MQQISPIAIAFVVGLLVTPLIRRISLRIGLVDRPDGHRKLHKTPVPLGGGVAVLLASVLTVLLTLLLDGPGAESIRRQPHYTLGLLGAATMICVVGLLDDRFAIRGRQKLVAQVVAVFLVVQSGMVIEQLEVFGWTLSLGLLAAPFTMAWLLGAINSLNLIDGVDGLAGTVAAILSITIAVLAGMTGQAADAIFAWALAGGVLGFLAWNLPPARIYLGDAGSMLVGLVLGVLAIRSSLKGPATVAMADRKST
ncbi:MAG: glycosyltransferase family 4 protein, partial [Maioricimonas sp. JB049]